MALTTSKTRCLEIKAEVEQRWRAEVKESIAGPDKMTIESVDEFLDFLDRGETTPDDFPGRSGKP